MRSILKGSVIEKHLTVANLEYFEDLWALVMTAFMERTKLKHECTSILLSIITVVFKEAKKKLHGCKIKQNVKANTWKLIFKYLKKVIGHKNLCPSKLS